jgi:hypothetical protein
MIVASLWAADFFGYSGMKAFVAPIGTGSSTPTEIMPLMASLARMMRKEASFYTIKELWSPLLSTGKRFPQILTGGSGLRTGIRLRVLVLASSDGGLLLKPLDAGDAAEPLLWKAPSLLPMWPLVNRES